MYRRRLADGAYDYVAPGVAELLGIAADALRAPGGAALVEGRMHPDDLARTRELVAAAVQRTGSAPAAVELEWRRRDAAGDYRWVHESMTVFRDARGAPDHIVGVLGDLAVEDGIPDRPRDAQARSDAEWMLKDSESRYALAMRGTNEGLWDWNPLSDALFLSSRLLTLLGAESDHLATTSAEWLKRIHEDDRPRFQAALIDHLKGRTPHFECEYRVLDQYGDYRWVLARGLAQRDGGGTAYRMVGSIGDITERKRAEVALRDLNRELESRVAVRTAELAVALKELESFSYSVSHDLRAPLRAIDGYSALLATELGDRLDDQTRELFERMRSAVQRMGMLIDDLLDLARVSRRPLERCPVSLSGLVQEIGMLLAHREPGRQVELEIEPEVMADADPNLARIALENLLANAWKFTARQDHPKVRFRHLVTEAGEDAFCVEDNGAGFDMRYVHKLFGAFQRLHHERDFPGTGIGLATVARIVQRHGGRIWARSAPGEGAAFCFTLAAAPHPTGGGR